MLSSQIGFGRFDLIDFCEMFFSSMLDCLFTLASVLFRISWVRVCEFI